MNKYKIVTFDGYNRYSQTVEAPNIDQALQMAGLSYSANVVLVKLVLDDD